MHVLFKEEIDFFFFQWFSVVDYLACYFTTAILKYSFKTFSQFVLFKF